MQAGFWALALTQPNAEHIASVNLERQKFPHHVFKIRSRAVVRGKMVERASPAFPRYIFVFIEDTWRALRGTRGISDVVRCGETLARVPEPVMNTLLARADGEGFLRDDPRMMHADKFEHGENVRVTEGVFSGFKAVFDCRTGEERVRVLLSYMNRLVTVEVQDSVLQRA